MRFPFLANGLQINNASKLHIESQSNRTNFRPLKNFPLLPLAFKINSGNSPKTTAAARCTHRIQENWYGYGILNSQISLSLQYYSAKELGPKAFSLDLSHSYGCKYGGSRT